MNTTKKYIYFNYEEYILLIFLFLYIVRIFSGRYLYALAYQPMKAPELDYMYWILLITKIPQFLINHPTISICIDISILLIIIYLLKYNKNIILKYILFIIFTIQHIVVETYTCQHSKSSVVICIALFTLLFNNKNQYLMLEFFRYFIIFILVSAAYHKIHNGAIFNINHFQTVLYEQHLDLQLLNPNHLSYTIAVFLRSNIYYAYIAFLMLFLTQLIFIIGIFTKKADTLLIILLILFIIMTYIVMRIYILELIICVPAFIYFIYQKELFFAKQST